MIPPDRAMKDQPSAWILVGPTAAGKTVIAQCLAEEKKAVVLSADAMLVYRGMDAGTAKPPLEYREKVPYFGIDIVAPNEPYNVALYLDEARKAVAFAHQQKKPLIIVGGSGLYIKCLLAGLDKSATSLPEVRRHWEVIFSRQGIRPLQDELQKTAPELWRALPDQHNPRRLLRALENAAGGKSRATTSWSESEQSATVAGIAVPRAILNERIFSRAEQFFQRGLLEEVRHLATVGIAKNATALQAIGYREALDHIQGHISLSEAIALTATRTRQLAKRQMTWFRHQLNIEWITPLEGQSIEDIARTVDALWVKRGAVRLHPSLYD